ncbi:MAG: hypothetical protein PHD56_07800 [Anaerostipes sp.]|nr:hypothetical protein [Anaerostipes sp.]
MSEFNYLAEKRRYLDSIGRNGGRCIGADCDSCMLYEHNNGHKGMYCDDFEIIHQEEATEMMRKWAEEHPRITNEEKFTQVFGVAAKKAIIPSAVGLRNKWWDEEYKKPKRSDESK